MDCLFRIFAFDRSEDFQTQKGAQYLPLEIVGVGRRLGTLELYTRSVTRTDQLCFQSQGKSRERQKLIEVQAKGVPWE